MAAVPFGLKGHADAGGAMMSVVFLSGPIGVGKTTLGRAVAASLGAAFLDGDDFAAPDRPWYASSLSTSRGILEAAQGALPKHRLVIVAYPLRCASYVYFRRRLSEAGRRTIFVTLRASYASIVRADRGRRLSRAEMARCAEMIAQGYAERPFSDLIIETDRVDFNETVDDIIARLKPLLAV